MTKEEYLRAINDVIYLASCVVNNKSPDKEKTEKMDLDQLYQAANKHMLTAIVGYALKSAGISSEKFHQAWAKSIRKVTAMDIDKDLLFQEMEKEKIWYMPLKGIIIKELYPAVGLRQMSDFDILFDKQYKKQVRDILISLGFSCEHFGLYNHDVYFKKPVSNFEMHSSLFRETHTNEIYNYYRSVKDRLIKDKDNNYGYHFSSNDLYIYVTAHEYKHYTSSGIGIRSLLDTYVIRQKLAKELDDDYINAECIKLGFSDFEQKNRQLAMHLFGSGELTEQDNKMLEYMTFSGTYGNMKNEIANSVQKHGGGKKGKWTVIRRRLFLPMASVKEKYPLVYRHKILLPGLFFYRIGKAVTVNRKQTLSKLNTLKKIK